MGKGGQLLVKQDITRAPTAKPPFTIGTLRKAIPPHCFKRSTSRSFAYLITDLLAVAALFYASTWIDHAAVPRWLAYSLLWPAYWFFQGAVCTGVWVIAHECGHQAFSESQAVNDTVGFIFHSLLLVPYYSWKHSHRRHHSNTGSVEKDEVFVPPTKEEVTDDFHLGLLWPVRLAHIVTTLTLGWPLYLAFNVAGREYSRFACHFDPYSPIFSRRERLEIVASDAGLAAVVAGLWAAGQAVGWPWLLKTYGIPYLVVNHWLVMITLLQHTHPSLPHYTGAEWDWLRGALCTADRSYGFLDHLFHHIADTHVAHHLFSQMPHYHAQEATAALKPVLGPYYLRDDRPIFRALWSDWRRCQYVAPDARGDGTLWYRK